MNAIDLETDDGLRVALGQIAQADEWHTSVGRHLLGEIRRRAVRNAAHIAAATGVGADRGLVDDVLMAAWMVLRDQSDKVLAVSRPWAYVMSSAQKHVTTEVWAQQALARASTVGGGRWREVMPPGIDPVGATPAELAVAFRHSPGQSQQVTRRPEAAVLVDPPPEPMLNPLLERQGWFVAFIDLLVAHGAHRAVTVAAVDHLSDLFATTRRWFWERHARKDALLARLGLSPDQASALVGLVAGSRECRFADLDANDGLLAAVRSAHERGVGVELSLAQRRRIAVYVCGDARPPRTEDSSTRRPVPDRRTAPSPDLVPT